VNRRYADTNLKDAKKLHLAPRVREGGEGRKEGIEGGDEGGKREITQQNQNKSSVFVSSQNPSLSPISSFYFITSFTLKYYSVIETLNLYSDDVFFCFCELPAPRHCEEQSFAAIHLLLYPS